MQLRNFELEKEAVQSAGFSAGVGKSKQPGTNYTTAQVYRD